MHLIEAIILGLGRFRRPIRDYFAICDSYYQAIKTSTAQQIETVDMARRGLHNEAAEMLMDRLDGKIAVDFDTGVITNLTKNESYQGEPFPAFIQGIISAGGLMNAIKAGKL